MLAACAQTSSFHVLFSVAQSAISNAVGERQLLHNLHIQCLHKALSQQVHANLIMFGCTTLTSTEV